MPNLISIGDLSAPDIRSIVEMAKEFDGNPTPHPYLQHRTVCHVFVENSTRTRSSFSIAAQRLGAYPFNFKAGASSLSKGETLKDTIVTLCAMDMDALVIRHAGSGVMYQIAQWVDVPIINAGDGSFAHPTQALLDVYTILQHHEDIQGLHVGIIGDIMHSRVARSLSQAILMLGGRVTFVGPPTLLPAHPEAFGVATSTDMDSVLPTLDVCVMLRVQRERLDDVFFPSDGAYTKHWGLTPTRVELLPDHAIIMHPGPVNREVEISGLVLESPRSMVTSQVHNGVAVRMAALRYVCEEA